MHRHCVCGSASVALHADLHDSMSALNHLSPPLDVRELLLQAVASGRVVLVVPWLAEMLAIMKFDAVSAFVCV